MKKQTLQNLSDGCLRQLYDAIVQVNSVLNPEGLTLATLCSFDMDMALQFGLFELDVFSELTRRQSLRVDGK